MGDSTIYDYSKISEVGGGQRALVSIVTVLSTVNKSLSKTIMALLFLLIVAVTFNIFASQKPPAARQTAGDGSSNTCDTQTTGYHVAGKKILDSQNKEFIPYGVQLNGILLAQDNWKDTSGDNPVLQYDTYDQMLAAHDFWHANTVSLQLASKALFAKAPFDADYLAKVDQDVQWATQLDMNIMLVLQYEGAGNSSQVLPTSDSTAFWSVVSARYARDSNVFFDIFNEPQSPYGNDDASAWALWKDGGSVDGVDYVGMQQLVSSIRSIGSKNLIFVDGLAAGEDIQLLSSYLLTGGNVVYAIHPYLGSLHDSSQEWDAWFGKAQEQGDFPVVANEWSQYQSGPVCDVNEPQLVPQLLAYLRQRNIGLIGYALFPGTLIRGWNFRSPTAYDGAYTCDGTFPNLSPTVQGAGQLLVQYFAKNSVQRTWCAKQKSKASLGEGQLYFYPTL